ncbi:unnamed protein product, partial [Meganyctiphanes norvegica]
VSQSTYSDFGRPPPSKPSRHTVVSYTLEPWPSLARQRLCHRRWSNVVSVVLISLVLVLMKGSQVQGASSSSFSSRDILKFTSSKYNASVPENALGNTPVVSDAMMGVFLPLKDTPVVRFRVLDGDSQNFFKASSRIVGDFCFLELHVRTNNRHVLNRESRDHYVLTVKAQLRNDDRTKEDIPGAVTEVTVFITDLNDLRPFFLNQEYRFRISEDKPLHSSVGLVKAEDPDEGLNGDIYYNFKEETNVFAVHPTSGVITLTRPLRFLEKPTYELTIEAKDRGRQQRGGWPINSKLYINVTEENIYDPQIMVTKLEEIVPRAHLSVVAIVNVLDNDRGPSGEVRTLEVVEGDPDKIFRILSGSNLNEFNLAALDTIDWVDYAYGFNLTLKATDGGSRPRFSYKVIRVAAPLDIPQKESPFTQEHYEITVNEMAPVGTQIVQLGSWIPGTQRTIQFTILAGNRGGHFNVDSTSGVLCLSKSLDYESLDYYSLTVIASTLSQRPEQQAAAKITVRVIDANDNSPIIVAPQGIVEVDEHESAGTWVTNIRAQDYDSEENGYVSYSLANGDTVPFTVDHFTGEVRTTRPLDFETENHVWQLQVRASDWGSPFRRQSEKVIILEVRDVNDNRPQFERIDCTGSVDRASPLGTEILTLSAVDFDQGNIISYRIVGGNADRCFTLDATSGVLSLTCDLSDLQSSEKFLNVTATDGEHFADTLTVQMQLVRQRPFGGWVSIKCREMGVAKRLGEQLARAKEVNKNENVHLLPPSSSPINAHRPELQNFPLEIRLLENREIGQVVLQVTAIDLDSGYEGHLYYSISGGNEEAVFNIDQNTGELKVAGLLDREHRSKYLLNITVYDSGNPRLADSRTVIVTILDENDNVPSFDKAAYSFFLPENVENGTNVYKLEAHDDDSGAFGVIRYALATDTSDFTLDPVTGQLSVSQPLDHEAYKVYELRVVAQDGGGQSSHAYVTIQVANINDCPPVFPEELSKSAVRVPEDLPVGALVTIAPAHDPDSDILRYSLEADSSYGGMFSIDPDTAVIRLAKPLDYENRPAYNISIWATDDGNPPLKAQCYVIIQVVDVNENIHTPVFGQDVLEVNISEDAPLNTLVASVPALDADVNTLDSSVTYHMVGAEGRGIFYINSVGNIYNQAWLDRETRESYWLTVKAQDAGTLPRHSILHVYVEVSDVNDHVPLSPWAAYWPVVAENSPPDTTVVNPINASDADANTILSYAITAGDPQSLFSIDTRTGEIQTSTRRLDREKQSEHVLEVTIKDGMDHGALTSKTFVTVSVTDDNDHTPRFQQRIYKFSVPVIEKDNKQKNGKSLNIGHVLAIDEDAEDNGEITYSIKTGTWNGIFEINPRTGSIYANREKLRVEEDYELTVEACDKGSEPKCSTCPVVLEIVPLASSSPNAPTILDSKITAVSVLETDPIGQHVKLVNAIDEDGDDLWFDIIGGNNHGKFTIGSDSGSLMIAGHLDAEIMDLYNLTIAVTDGVNSITCQVVISVLDVNDNRPTFTLPQYEVEISENTSPGTTIYTLTATDADRDPHLTFTLHNTGHIASAEKFKINPTTGDIVVMEILDREVQDRHILTVCVQDRITPIKKDYARVIINIRDYNDHAPKFLVSQYNGTVMESALIGSWVTEIQAVDHDKEANGHITYNFVSGNVGGVFSLEPETGVISLARSINHREMPEYWLVVRAADNGSPPKYAHTNVNIHVKIAMDAPPRFMKKSYNFEVSESSRIGDYLGILEVESHLGVVFSLFSPINLPFSINPSSGILVIDSALDYEKVHSYNFSVIAISMNKKESLIPVVVNVQDENDNIPYFSQKAFYGHISEAASINSVVLMEENIPLIISATDADSGLNSHIIYTIVEQEARNNFTIDEATGSIRTAGPLDHEAQAKFTFTVSVQDSGSPSLQASTTATVHITINDINDIPPIFILEQYNATIFSPTHTEVAVVQLEAKDQDFDGKANLKFSIVDGNIDHKFEIDSKSGMITVKDPKDLSRNYNLKATVSDGQFESSTSVNIQVKNLPNSGLRFSQDKYFAAIEENSTIIEKVTMVQVLGSTLNEHLKFSILNPSHIFIIGETSGVIHTTGKPVDREQKDNYLLLVQVASLRKSSIPRIAHVEVHVVIMDVNDNAPIFVNTPYYGIVAADAIKGHQVFKVQATDFDADGNSAVHYELQRGNGDLFLVNPTSGAISLRQSLEGLQPEYELFITAYDAGSPPLSSTVSVRLKIVDRSQPVFDRQFYSATVGENAEPHTPVITLTAMSQLNRKLIYTITAGNKDLIFDIEHEEGTIRVQDTIDFESQKGYQLTVRAADSVSGKFAEVVVSVQVIDGNDNSPVFPQHIYRLNVSEAADIATPILTVSTTDRDIGPNAGVSYQVINSNGTIPDDFYITSDTGILMLKRSLDREKLQYHQFLVVATDKGTPPLSAYAQIIVTVLDMNDNPPVFEQQPQLCVVTEGATRGHFVSKLSAWDQDDSDMDRLAYSIVDGNHHQAFDISSTTGVITVWNSQKLQTTDHHILNVSVTDGVFTAYTPLAVSIAPVNDYSPTFDMTQYEAKIIENAQRKTRVIKVSAMDRDSGRYGDVTYHFVGDQAQKYFRINENTGEVWTLESLDHEKQSEYFFTIMAQDIGGRTGFTTLHVVVGDVNDNRPLFQQSRYKATVRENATAGTLVAKVMANDADSGDNGLVSFDVHSSTPQDTRAAFTVHPQTGEIRLTQNAQELGSSAFEFFILVRDGGNPGLHSTATVVLHIINQDISMPEFRSRIYTFTVSEATQTGTTIGSVAARYPGALGYSVEWNHQDISSPVSISQEGILILSGLLDYEIMSRFILVVIAQPLDQPQLAQETTVVIEVQDINDMVPTFESEKYYVSIAENTPFGSNFIKVGAVDGDSGSNAEVRYILKESSPLVAEPMFTLDPYSGWLALNGKLDAETQSKYELEVIASDGGTPQQTSAATIIVQVVDYNDNAPKFSKAQYNTSVLEDALPGTVVAQLDVYDYDLSGGEGLSESQQIVQYYLTQGNEMQHFHVRSGGQIYVAKPLNRENTEQYNLEVTATDGVFMATAQVLIEIKDVNDNAPECNTPYYHTSISESAEPGTILLQVSASDKDLVGKPMFFLTGSGAGMFTMDSDTGHISVLKILDREIQSHFSLKATVRDSGHEEWTCPCQVEIDVTDVNDNAPVFSQNTYSANVPENSPKNLLLLKVHASDNDKGMNRKVKYSLEGKNIFLIDEDTGIVSVTESLDRETRAMYNLTVQATDHGSPPLASYTNILVLVSDVNDNPPEFASRTYYTTVAESSSIGSEVVRVLATSRDSGKNADITYSIIGGNEHRKFSIHPKTGVVLIEAELDYERAHNYQLTIQAQDGGEPPLSNHATVNVTITDVNDNAPIFIQNSYSAIVNEAALVGKKVIQVVATDLDSGSRGKVSYAVANGDLKRQFRIDELSGWILVGAQLDREVKSAYSLEVVALDDGVPQQSGSVLLNIDISDANDNPPVFVDTNHTAYVKVNYDPINAIVFKFEVIDDDDESANNGGPFTHEIRSGNDAAAFRITQEGELRTATKFKHHNRRKNVYQLQIRVYDNGRPPLYSETWIDVMIIPESQFPPVVYPLSVSVFVQSEENSMGYNLGSIKATDEDPYDSLSYFIVENKLGINEHYFRINSRNGTLAVKNSLDEGSYTINISVTDGKFTKHTQAVVEVVDIKNEIIENSVILQLGGATPQEFLLSYKRHFHRTIKNILSVKSRDVVIIGLQNGVHKRYRRGNINKNKNNRKTYSEAAGVDILFVVQKSNDGYFPRNVVRKTLELDRHNLQDGIGLQVIEIVEDSCFGNTCENGDCEERIILDDEQVTITTEHISFVSLLHHHEAVCICPQGFSGARCDIVVNQCAHRPCPPFQECVPDTSSQGYLCQCPKGFVGFNCSKPKSKCLGDEINTPECYAPRSSLSFKGKSFAQYSLHNPIERHFSFSVWLRTLHPSGNIMFTSGRIDYSILEVSGGEVRYRWDLGSGEGLVAVTSLHIDDGQWHHIALERFGGTSEVVVDGHHRAVGSSPGSSDLLNLETTHLYLGAEVRPWAGAQDPRQGLHGCMDDPRVDDHPLPLTHTHATKVASLNRLNGVSPNCLVLTPPGVCGSHPCLNGGTCKEWESSFICQCHPRFQGSRCESDSNPCASSPCLNNGHCVNINNNYRCECPAGVSGSRCQYMYCNPNPCLNRGVCEEGITGPICKCRGFTGAYCNIDVNECSKNPCHNGGSCVNTYGSFQCLCPGNATGVYCDTLPTTLFRIDGILYIAIGIGVVLLTTLVTMTAVCCHQRKVTRQRQLLNQTNHVVLKPKNTDNHNNCKRNSKITNLEATHNLHGCTSRSESFPTNPSEPVYMPLNNFDTIRSYGSAGDELENLPHYSREFMNSISKGNSLQHQYKHCNSHASNPIGSDHRSATLGSSSHASNATPDKDTLHKAWKGALSNNLKDTYYDRAKIQNDVKYCGGEYMSLRRLADDSRSNNSLDDHTGYHWDCSDWARPSQNPLPNIMEVPGGEVRDSSSYHSNESNESIVVTSATNQSLIPPDEGPVDPGRDMETLPADESISECDTEFELESRHDLNNSQYLEQVSDTGAESDSSLFMPQPQRYESHPNKYLPKYQMSESGTEDESRKLINNIEDSYSVRYRKPSQLPQDRNGATYSPYQVRSKRRSEESTTKKYTDTGGGITSVAPAAEDEERVSLWGGGASNTSTSDLDNVCDIEDSEVNSEFENDGRTYK